jgi:hypothetical protein
VVKREENNEQPTQLADDLFTNKFGACIYEQSHIDLSVGKNGVNNFCS